MFSFMNFKWLLKIIYRIAKLFGFLFMTINFDSIKNYTFERRISDLVIFFASFGLSLFACTYDGILPVAALTHSELSGVGVNLICRLSIYATCVLKAANMVFIRRFYDIIVMLNWNHMKVRSNKPYKAGFVVKF